MIIESSTTLSDNDISHDIKVKEAARWKGKKNENSVFYVLFNPDSNPEEVASLIAEFYRDFCNSIYFYTRNDSLEIEGLEDEEEDEEPKPVKKQKKE